MVLLSCCYYELGIQKQKRENYNDNTNHNENFFNISSSYKGTSGTLNYHFIFFCTSA